MNGAKAGSTEAMPFDVIDLTPTTIVAYQASPAPARPPTVEPSAGRALTAAPGDVLSVRIFERYEGATFPTIQNDAASDLGNKIVTPEGTIEVPYVGTVKVAGLRPREIEAEITARIANKAKEPQVLVDFVADRTNTVMVSGDVKNPGRVSLSEGLRTVMDAINRAGGPVEPKLPPAKTKKQMEEEEDAAAASSKSAAAGSSGGGPVPSSANPLFDEPKVQITGPWQLEVIVRRQGRLILDKQLSELMQGGDIGIEKGDEIVLRPNEQVVTILGAVAKAGNVQIKKPNMSLAETLGAVGGLVDLRSNKTGLYVFRMGDLETNPSARARIFRLDFMQPSSVLVAQQFPVQPRDVVFVANAPLREYDKVLSSLYRSAAFAGGVVALTK
ncbi:protein involved in polysaccharide export, contains SLBB domain of the beta-grasp fold [Enhydrobacter aerosaccus]|uniref:Protein involved in polysaccharide export, contains SLBB domain of the beta-grasp fold n=2 Tax=Enhydrobacter aerosaccus TaxID=225324 RepID=A0A1T4SVV2_9HYPH|nr:protein involved in polysaccharide export, contains SLBB domain of the beta-grasp fold [Enhydrobacter aerosaccus]